MALKRIVVPMHLIALILLCSIPGYCDDPSPVDSNNHIVAECVFGGIIGIDIYVMEISFNTGLILAGITILAAVAYWYWFW
jgi:hypothetical protein